MTIFPRRLAALLAALVVAWHGAASAQEPEPARPLPIQLQGLLPEPGVVDRAFDFAARTMGDGGGDKSGLYAETSNMITGAGWLSLGPGYRRWFGDRLFTDASAALSWREYKMARGRIELTNLARSRVAIGAEAKWHDYTQNAYFGAGADSLESNRSEYRLKTVDMVGYTRLRLSRWLTVGASAGWLRRPELLDPSGWFLRGNLPTTQVFAGDAALRRVEQPDYLHGELSIVADTRDRRSHPLQGGVYRAAWMRFSDRDGGAFSFQRFEAEGAQFATIERARLTFAVHGWLTASDAATESSIPFYLIPSLGGNNTLRSYANYRFHGRHFAVANAEVRVALLDHLDAALFVDAGNVAATLSALNLDKRSYGVGFRLHSTRSTFARLDLARGREGWRVIFSTNDPLHLSRLTRRTAPIPFVP